MTLLNEIISLAEQGTDIWDKVRLGKFTSSEMHRLMTDGKRPMTKEEIESMKLAGSKSKATTIADATVLSEGARTYVLEKVAEDITGESAYFENFATKWGTEHEPIARNEFEKRMKLDVEQVGFVPFNEFSGGSPDGIFYTAEGNKDGILEIKCPYNSANHIEHLLIQDQKYFKDNFKEYYWQMQSNMLFTGTSKAWFISFDPRAKDHALFMMLFVADKLDHELIEKKIKVAVEFKKEILSQINSKKQSS